ncbi:enolase C-terminal domain-like protein [Arcobacter sp. LA11]|uniref:enolase C-terminal domain-like protein n=1 Tax=Arcobacter sp. LA11 TaxID=1898176 RepID=UPI000932861F|nr:enolase C-terminal domain-like protein [Arcobacter sp. LA11]
MSENISTIKSIRVRPVVVPMQTPHQTASGIITESPLILIDISMSDGNIGHSMIFTYTKLALKATADFIQNLEPLVIGERLVPLDIFLKLNKQFRLLGTQGLVGMSIAGIDMALWDALARQKDLSLTNLLGGKAKPIKAYGAVGYDGAEVCAKVAKEWSEKGLKGIKAKIGYPTVEEDIEVIQAMREATGEDMSIMVDYNQSLTPIEAIKRHRILDKEKLAWIEEPTLAHDYIGHSKIAKETKTPIQCGENWWGILDMQHAIQANASDYIMLDVMKIGGVTGWIRAAAIANAHNIEISSHLWPEISAQLLCCTPTTNWLEYCDWWNPILKNPLVLENGNAIISDCKGSGIQWDEKAAEKYSVIL